MFATDRRTYSFRSQTEQLRLESRVKQLDCLLRTGTAYGLGLLFEGWYKTDPARFVASSTQSQVHGL